ncbi:hypothetical protein HU200_058237 [Digitaria exilis]|uniref:Uncharacterized protein n=1 Tax=Digitaria exilis TaxID=1010633 RepID=A0A835ACV7_9POAL|nr:hypothetical protein HU200_058237 [Digitaria exilis]
MAMRSGGHGSMVPTRSRSRSVIKQHVQAEIALRSSSTKAGDEHKVLIQTAFSMTALDHVCSKLSDEKKEIVCSIGFGSLLSLPWQTKISRQIVFWIMRHMDLENGAILVGDGAMVRFTEEDVNLVLGIPCKGKVVLDENYSTAIVASKIKSLLMLGPENEMSITTVQSIVMREYSRKMTPREREAFKIAFVIYIDACFLWPRGQAAKPNQGIYKHLVDTSSMQDINWCAYVIRGVKESAAKVFYLDNLDFGVINTSHRLVPRAREYTYPVLKKLVAADKNDNIGTGISSFGRTKVLRADDEVMYKRKFAVATEVEGLDTKENDTMIKSSVMDATRIMTNWVAFVEKITCESTKQLLQIARRIEEAKNQDQSLLDRGANTRGCMRVEDVASSSNAVTTPPASGSQPAIINHETPAYSNKEFSPEIDGSDVSEDYSISPEICAPNVRDSQGLTDSDDTRLRYGIEDERRTDMSYWSWSTNREIEGEETMRLELAMFDHFGGSPDALAFATPVEDDGCPEDSCNYIVKVNGIEFNAALLQPTTTIGMSPFAVDLTHPDAPFSSVLTLYKCLMETSGEDKDRTWFLHYDPIEVRLEGRAIQMMFASDVDFNKQVVTAITRLYHTMDDDIYACYAEKRCRHFLPPGFAVSSKHCWY